MNQWMFKEKINGYLVLVCALLELFEFRVEYCELPGDALYPCVQTPVLAVLSVEVILVTLTLLLRTDHCVLSVEESKRKHKLFLF